MKHTMYRQPVTKLITPMLLLLGLLAAACSGASLTPTATPDSTAGARSEGTIGGQVGDLAPEFLEIASWINSEPLTMAELRGQVVLIDFWTYTCVNCIRTFPYLKEWHRKYADKGLVIVGVHRPEFTFEENRENVISAVERHGLQYPTAQDNASATWDAYSNRFWPAKYLIDANGYVHYTHFGEGAYAETEGKIRELLVETGAEIAAIDVVSLPPPVFDPTARFPDPYIGLTRELYGGYLRNASINGLYVADPLYYDRPEVVQEYTDPGGHENQFLYLQGPWINGLESLIHARETEEFQDYIALKFFARSVNAVIEPQVEEPFEIQLTMDGRFLRPEEAGADVTFRDGRSFVLVDEPRMYRMVELPAFGDHELKLSAKSEGFALFAFTFGAYLEGP